MMSSYTRLVLHAVGKTRFCLSTRSSAVVVISMQPQTKAKRSSLTDEKAKDKKSKCDVSLQELFCCSIWILV
jgi:regulator of extracellular matrix RemA (YlzA/DUF370 family)